MPAATAARPPFRRLDWAFEPIDLITRWPVDRPLACLISSGSSSRARWSIFASPSRSVVGDATLPDPSAPLRSIARHTGPTPSTRDPSVPPFLGGWIGWLSYDLGRRFEPAAQHNGALAIDDRAWPLYELLHCPGAFIHDAESGSWLSVGDAESIPDPGDPIPHRFEVGRFAPRTPRADYESAVARTIEYIRAGDIFQANLAHRLSAAFNGSPRALARRLLVEAGPWYGSYIESPARGGGIARAICSASPELFLEFDASSRRVITRPIKGTRPASPTSLRELAESTKDAAELTMIVDLMRNDLGRVCEYGTVTVDHPRQIESHARSAIHHGVATISGTLRPDAGIADLLCAAFPPGSVTGAPKVRAMQIIDELEPVRRGPYCGCVGYISESGDSAWNVAIRTAAITCELPGTAGSARGTIDYAVGAGIVADSDPRAEWLETMSKAGILAKAFPHSFDSAVPA